ncbi:MAG: hypothetical protein IPO21_09485 [Bacteroidales bacterium]|nr:hypothetical protein [Bacteroidales bacterium]
MRKIIYITIILMLFVAKIYGQHENTLYFMDRVPQQHYLNPALTPDCKWWIGGLIIPVVGQLPPPLHLDLNLPLDYNDLIYPGSGDYADSLVTFLHPSQDVNTFLDKLSKNNYTTLEYHLNYLFFGLRIKKKAFITLDVSDRMYAHVNIPKDVFSLVLTGNAIERDANLSGLSFNLNYYREFALGFSYVLSKYSRVGVRGKFLMGVANINTAKSDIMLNTAETVNDLSLKANYQINTNFPIESVSFDESGKFIEEIEFQNFDFQNFDSVKNFIVNDFALPKNYGWSVDIGLKGDWNSELSYYVSAVDIGSIKWSKNPSNFSLEGDSAFIFKGIELRSLKLDSLKFPDLNEILEDTYLTYSQNAYRTWLPFKIFGGLRYKLTRRISLGVLARFEKLDKSWLNAYTGSLNFNMFRFGNMSLSYSYNNKVWNNIGWAYTIRFGAFQWYVIGENKIGSRLFPDKTRNIGFRFGCNLVFGRGGKKKGKQGDLPLLNTL